MSTLNECEAILRCDEYVLAILVNQCHFPHTPVRVWSWAQAPSVLRQLSRHGGDEDWVAMVPEGMEDLIDFYELARCEASRHVLPRSKTIIYIGAHS